jgi:hypothetical protein
MFFVHYLTEREAGSGGGGYDEEPTFIFPSLGTLLHYRNEGKDGGTVYGQILGRGEDREREDKINRCLPNGVLGYRDIRRFQDEKFFRRVQEAILARAAPMT